MELEKLHFFQKTLAEMNNDECILSYAEASFLKKLHKGEYLLRQGDVQNMVYFIKSGILVGTYLDEKGKDCVSCISNLTGDIGLSTHNQVKMNVASPENLIALEDTEIYCMPMESLIQFNQTFVESANFTAKKLSDALERYRDQKIILSQCSAKDRYLWFLENYPGVIHRIKHTYIASFLAMNPSTLSRIREKLENETF